nr:XopAU family type III secretion system effector serine/threonine kinase [Burkholderia cepacia]
MQQNSNARNRLGEEPLVADVKRHKASHVACAPAPSGGEDAVSSLAPARRSSSHRRSASLSASPLSPIKPRVPDDPTGSSVPREVLRGERKLTRNKTELVRNTLSPGFVAELQGVPISDAMAAKIAAMKPGVAEAEAGFRRMKLAPSLGSPSSSQELSEELGKGAFGTVYAVTLAENLIKDGKNFGRDFVFKALLRPDRDKPIPPGLYTSPGSDEPRDAAEVEKEIHRRKQAIIQEFQITSALRQTSRVMQVYELAEIDGGFGVLSERINGANIGKVIDAFKVGLEAEAIRPEEHMNMVRQAISDVLVAIARCAEEGVVHADISPNNVMYDRDEKIFKLIDMGNGREIGQTRPEGTPGYSDSGVRQTRPQGTAGPSKYEVSHVADEKADLYSAGQLLAKLVTERTLTPGHGGVVRPGHLKMETFPFTGGLEHIPDDDKRKILSAIERMIQPERENRPTAEEMLSDPLFMGLAPRDEVHESYEYVNLYAKYESVVTRYNQCCAMIGNEGDGRRIYELLSALIEAWYKNPPPLGDIEKLLSQLYAPDVQEILRAAERAMYSMPRPRVATPPTDTTNGGSIAASDPAPGHNE